ncbi:MAG: hypothetical protein K9M97_11615 [Akkermansiaceae bacterium]|nr:hypothetical protein [Akkermansiaceae bacterium]
MKLTRYHPPFLRLQEEFAARIARRRYTRGKSPKTPKLQLADNSEPWLANPDSVADYLAISSVVKESEEQWQSRFKGS